MYDTINTTLLSYEIIDTLDRMAFKWYRINPDKIPSRSIEFIGLGENGVSNGSHWASTVIAYDMDNHYRVTENKIWHFHILWPDIQIKKIEFKYSPWITESDTQGVINIQIHNDGEIRAENILVTINSSIVEGKIKRTVKADTIFQKLIPQLGPREIHNLQFTWLESNHGFFNFYINTKIIEPDNQVGKESNMANNDSSVNFYTIPKGNFTTKDTATSFIIPYTHHDVPFTSRVFFDQNSTEVKSSYYYRLELLLKRYLIALSHRLID
jgi:hypothetical protein